MRKKYSKRIFLGYDKDGKRIQKRIYGDTKKELYEEEYQLKHGKLPSGINFKAFSDDWLRVYKANNSNATRTNYERILRLQCLPLHGLPLSEITRTDCQAIINESADKPPTCKKIYTTLNQIFDCAVEDGYIDRNPMSGVTLPKSKPVTRRILSQAEKERIPTANLSEPDRMYMLCLLYFGLRPAEAIALCAEDFDLVRETVTINKAFEFPHNQAVLKDTKTGNERVIPIPTMFIHDLKMYLPKHGYIFTSNGQPCSRTVMRRMFAHIKKEIGDADLHPYVFRYNYATTLYYSGISLKKAAYLLGHSNTSMILKIYAQLDDSQENLSPLKTTRFF